MSQEAQEDEASAEPHTEKKPSQQKKAKSETERLLEATAAKEAKPGTAGAAPQMKLMRSANGEACACLIVIHDDERNARLMAQLLHQHCAYDLILLTPDSGSREIKLPGHGKVDPNGLFPPDIAELCTTDEAACRKFLTDKFDSKKRADIKKFVQIQFFLAVKEGSAGFTKPVVALHNNRTTDTPKFRKKLKKDKVDTSPLEVDIDKLGEAENENEKDKKKLEAKEKKRLEDLLDSNFGEEVRKQLTSGSGKTNIFRWCVANDLSKCHIGDPDHPDHVIWVTHEEDFKKLSKKDVNVAFQTDLSKAVGTPSETDLSTLFLVLESLKDSGKAKNIDADKLRYLNIETPGLKLSAQTDSQRVEDFQLIKGILESVDLYCCGDPPESAEQGIETGLRIDEAAKKKKEQEKAKKEKEKESE